MNKRFIRTSTLTRSIAKPGCLLLPLKPWQNTSPFAVLAVALNLWSNAVVAQEASEPDARTIEVVAVTGKLTHFGATKSSVPIVETARSISIESADRLIEKGALNLSQATAYMAGVTSETFGFSTRGDWVHSRALDIPRYRDSIQELFGSYNTTRADVYTIEQVELLKGPASVLYGQGSAGGIVNYVSKTPKNQHQAEVVAQSGNFDRTVLGVDVTGPFSSAEQWLFRLVGLYRNAGTQVDYVDDNTKLLMPSLTYTPSHDTRFTLIGLYQKTQSDSAAQFVPVEGTLFPLPDGTWIDQDVYIGEPGFNRFDTQSKQLTFLAQHQFNEIFSLEITALWRDGKADYHQAWPVFTGAGNSRYLNASIGMPVATATTAARTFYQADNASEQYAGDIRLSADFDTAMLSHNVLIGVQYQDVITDSNRAYFFGGGALSGDFSFVLDLANPVYTGAPAQAVFDALYTDRPEQTVEDAGLYISDQISVGNWRITTGVRFDQVDNDDGLNRQQKDQQTSLSAGVLYHFANGFSPYISYAESFETVVGTNSTGDQLKPEQARQYEAGLKYEPEGLPGLFTLSWFDIEISNLPNPNSLPDGASQQQGISTIKGVEFEGKLILGDFYFQGALTLLDAKDPNDFELAGEPDSNASLWTTWRPQGKLSGLKAGAGIRYVGKSVSENASIRYETPDYTLGDLSSASSLFICSASGAVASSTTTSSGCSTSAAGI